MRIEDPAGAHHAAHLFQQLPLHVPAKHMRLRVSGLRLHEDLLQERIIRAGMRGGIGFYGCRQQVHRPAKLSHNWQSTPD